MYKLSIYRWKVLKMHVIFGFYEKKIISAIDEELKRMDVEFDFSYCKTKLDVLNCVMNEENIDAIVLLQTMKFDGKWSDYELSRLTDGRDINVIPILDTSFRGTEYLKMLYAAGITSALLDSATPQEVAKLIVNKRELREARKYYGIGEDDCFITLDEVTDDKAKVYLRMLEDADKDGCVPETFDNICSELNTKQVKNLIERLNYRLKELSQDSITYKSVYGENKKETPFFPDITKFESKKKKTLNMLYGFDSENTVKHIESRLKNAGYVIKDSVTKYNKEGIRTYLRDNEVSDAVIIENLEMKGGYTPEEIAELRLLKDVNIIMALTQKKGSLYLNKLYCSGVLNSIIGNVSVTDISKLILNGRCRSEARSYYGLEIGGIYTKKICDKYKDYIVTYFNRGHGKLRDKYLFVESLLSKEQLIDVITDLPESLRQVLISQNIIDDPDKKKGLFAFFDNKSADKKKDNKNPDKDKKIENKKNLVKKEEIKTDDKPKESDSNIDPLGINIVENKEPDNVNKKEVDNPSNNKNLNGNEIKKQDKPKKPERLRKNFNKKFLLSIPVIIILIILFVVIRMFTSGSDETFEQNKNDDLVIVPEIVTDVAADSYEVSTDDVYNEENNENVDANVSDDVNANAPESVAEIETPVNEIQETEIVADEEVNPVSEEVQVETTRKNRKKKKKNTETVVPTTKVVETSVVVTTKAAETKKKEEETKKLGSYSESNAISSSKISIIRNSVTTKFSGSSSSEKSNLAKYMSANKLSDASGTYKKLTNSSKSFSVKTYSVSVESASQDNILKAAEKASSGIGSVSGDYGIGISSYGQSVGFKIYIVVVY